MAAPITNAGHKSDKLITDALRVALTREAKDADGKPTKRLYLMADKVAQLAADGVPWAVKEVFDRLEGRAQQTVAIEAGQSLLSILEELEQRRELQEIDGEVINNDFNKNNDLAESALQIEHGANVS